jgi:hypothetical protein
VLLKHARSGSEQILPCINPDSIFTQYLHLMTRFDRSQFSSNHRKVRNCCGQVGAIKGQFVDASPFQKCVSVDEKEGRKSGTEESTIDKYGKQLKEYGFNYHGTEVMYSGLYGNEMTCEIYLGVVYYQRLRHMVSDKFQVRACLLKSILSTFLS